MSRFVFRGRLHISPYAACCYAIFFKLLIPALAGRLISGDEAHEARQRDGYQVTPKLSLSCPMHAGNKTDLAQKMSPPVVKQAAYGETRAAIIKKKLMKNKLSVEAAAPANADQQSSTGAEKQRAFAKHCANRELPTQKVLDYLRAQLPQQYELAEVVGKWIWLEFPKASHRAAANTLWRLGFHWNQRRCVWQHPCERVRPMPRTPPTRAPNTAVILPPT